MISDSTCPLCKRPAEVKQSADWIYEIVCGACGVFLLEFNLYSGLVSSPNIHRLKISAYTRERTIAGRELVGIIPEGAILASPFGRPIVSYSEILQEFPSSIGQRIDRTLVNLSKMSRFIGDTVSINDSDFSVFFADDINHYSEQQQYMLKRLLLEDLIELSSQPASGWPNADSLTSFPWKLRLTTKGWNRTDELERRPSTDLTQAFVAMWFADNMHPIWSDAIKPAIEQAGYTAIRVDKQDFNHKIDDEIIAQIRRSRFVVCDFTGARPGVYFEAGFAMGLGIPVIWMCKNGSELHFDTRQYNHIIWNSADDLKARLLNRIRATIV